MQLDLQQDNKVLACDLPCILQYNAGIMLMGPLLYWALGTLAVHSVAGHVTD